MQPSSTAAGRQVTFGGEQICPVPAASSLTSEPSLPVASTPPTQASKKCERCGRSNGSNVAPNVANQVGANAPDASAKPESNSIEENEIVDKAKQMGQMLIELVQFTQGASELKTTQDYFTLAETLGEEANKFYKLVRQFTYQVKFHFFPLDAF